MMGSGTTKIPANMPTHTLRAARAASTHTSARLRHQQVRRNAPSTPLPFANKFLTVTFLPRPAYCVSPGLLGISFVSSRCPAPRWLGRWLECSARNGRSPSASCSQEPITSVGQTICCLCRSQEPQSSRDRCWRHQAGVKTVGQQPSCHSQGRRTWRICGLGAKFFKERLAPHIVRPSLGNAARSIVKVGASGRYAKSQR
ncbi:hypothetical protein BDP55DRAFT_342598 [Colletotrichum godetiae]|uniref:Uncharacterized protein n=1 Tax=Colletotrichum godetiae TaxID=1209918 RepID=A0AAJ0EXT0_9PEZI|nr:uncharacterized protein BDP55DRAFT_342598 [Colletotrichum godetiae]KAK1690235.1 hypothetical protein BDP55DRAFT_342598 [Colletotrichum godetiae]